MVKLRRKRMLELMDIKQMNRNEVAAAIGVSAAHFRNVLNGRRRLSLKHTKRLMELFGSDLMYHAIDWEAMNIRNPFAGT